jgi:Flp pilus assembly pilin Flp
MVIFDSLGRKVHYGYLAVLVKVVMYRVCLLLGVDTGLSTRFLPLAAVW